MSQNVSVLRLILWLDSKLLWKMIMQLMHDYCRQFCTRVIAHDFAKKWKALFGRVIGDINIRFQLVFSNAFVSSFIFFCTKRCVLVCVHLFELVNVLVLLVRQMLAMKSASVQVKLRNWIYLFLSVPNMTVPWSLCPAFSVVQYSFIPSN